MPISNDKLCQEVHEMLVRFEEINKQWEDLLNNMSDDQLEIFEPSIEAIDRNYKSKIH